MNTDSKLTIQNMKSSYESLHIGQAIAIALPEFPELAAVLTLEEAVTIYNVTVYEIYHDVVVNAVIPSRQSGKTWLVRAVDAMARWGKQ